LQLQLFFIARKKAFIPELAKALNEQKLALSVAEWAERRSKESHFIIRNSLFDTCPEHSRRIRYSIPFLPSAIQL